MSAPDAGPVGEPDADAAAPCRVAFVTQWFPPEPTHTPLWIAQALRRQGLDIDVLTGIPNYPTGVVHPGYSARRRRVERHDGFRVTRTPLYPSHDRSVSGRAANYGSYALSAALLGAPVLRAADVALVYSSPATAAVPALLARLRWRIPYVLMVMDLWPDSVFATGFLTTGVNRRIAEAALTALTRQAYRWADHVAVTSPGMRDALVDRGVPAERLSVVYNWADEKVMQPTEPDHQLRGRLGLDRGFVLMYGGNHGAAQRLDVAIQAMAQLRDLPDVHLVLVGEGVEKPALRALAHRLGLRTVHFVDPVPPARMPAVLASADLHLVCLADQPLFRMTLPSKVQSLLACGQPVLCCAPGDATRAVTEAGAGLTAPPEDPVALAQAIRRAYAMPAAQLRAMGRAGYHHYLATMSESINAGRLADLLSDAARRRRQHHRDQRNERR